MMNKPLTAKAVKTALTSLPGWNYVGNSLKKTFTFPTFREALGFMLRVGFEAEGMNHHPDWSNVYNRVVVRLCTHDAKNRVTAKDVALARKIQAISWVD